MDRTQADMLTRDWKFELIEIPAECQRNLPYQVGRLVLSASGIG
jgi:hypothetical protein